MYDTRATLASRRAGLADAPPNDPPTTPRSPLEGLIAKVYGAGFRTGLAAARPPNAAPSPGGGSTPRANILGPRF